jgi:preprotein translocase subunit SecD
MIRGFALTLGIGVLLSMFSAIFISRLLLLNFVSNKSAGHWWFNVSKKREILTTEKI